MLAAARRFAASRASRFKTACETLRRRKPGSSVSEGSAPSPCRFASTRAALPLAAAAVPSYRARGEECRGSLCRSEHRAPLAAREADLTGAGRGSTRTASGASAAVARRASRWSCFLVLAFIVVRFAESLLIFFGGILTTGLCTNGTFQASKCLCQIQ